MIDFLESTDQFIVLSINGWHTPLMDEFMWAISGKLIWLPMYVTLIMMYWRKFNGRMTLVFVLAALLVVGLTDLISSQFIKEIVMRYRPSHHAELSEQLHFYQLSPDDYYKGGMYGFVSSHAANFFGLCTFVSLVLREQYKRISVVLTCVACLVSLSRIYLGVHYLTDILGGAILGGLIAVIVYRFLFIAIIRKETIRK
ncbi:phosphatase PAP2 family protein [Crocinitomicaceae bacterium]|nr:phosphatase PAP2 family protein [Crocinitomicaceae bacterium]